MRDLLTPLSSAPWAEVSAVLFALMFVAVSIWVYLPFRSREYQRVERLPLNED